MTHQIRKTVAQIGVAGLVIAVTGNRVLATGAGKLAGLAMDHFAGKGTNDNEPPIIDGYPHDEPGNRRNG